MVVEIVRPSSDYSNPWTFGNWTNIDDNVEQPAIGDRAVSACLRVDEMGWNDANETYQCNMQNLDYSAEPNSVTQIKVWINARRLNTTQPSVNIYVNGGNQSSKIGTIGTSYSWSYYTWGGLTLDGVDDLRVLITAPNFGDEEEIDVDVVYAEITYTIFIPTGPEGIEKVYGVDSSAIEKKYGTNWSDITKIYGIT